MSWLRTGFASLALGRRLLTDPMQQLANQTAMVVLSTEFKSGEMQRNSSSIPESVVTTLTVGWIAGMRIP